MMNENLRDSLLASLINEISDANGTFDKIKSLINRIPENSLTSTFTKEDNESYLELHSLLTLAISHKKDIAVLELLIDSGINVNQPVFDKETSLTLAAFEGEMFVVRLLLDKGADVNHETKQGNTALIYAISSGNRDLIELLLERGADLNHETKQGNTALIHATSSNGSNSDLGKIVDLIKMFILYSNPTDFNMKCSDIFFKMDESVTPTPLVEIIENAEVFKNDMESNTRIKNLLKFYKENGSDDDLQSIFKNDSQVSPGLIKQKITKANISVLQFKVTDFVVEDINLEVVQDLKFILSTNPVLPSVLENAIKSSIQDFSQVEDTFLFAALNARNYQNKKAIQDLTKQVSDQAQQISALQEQLDVIKLTEDNESSALLGQDQNQECSMCTIM